MKPQLWEPFADEKPPPTQVAAQKKATEFFDIGSPCGGAEEAESTEESVEAEPGAASAVEAGAREVCHGSIRKGL